SPFRSASGALTLTLSRERERGPETRRVAPTSFAIRHGGRSAMLLSCAALLLAPGCAKVSPPAGAGTGSSSGTGGNQGTGTGGVAGPGTGGFVGRGDDGGLIASDAGGTVCQEGNYKSVPQIPTVFIVVDQSGSMFKCRTSGGQMDSTGKECANHADTSWYPMRDGVLTVVSKLQDQVRFGFAAFTGEIGDAMCPVLSPVAPLINNQMAIATKYNGLVAPKKGETPTRKALEQVAALLKADTTEGEKFILFITDGEPDYCDDGNSLCAPDSVVGELQTLATGGIKTLVMGISSPLTTISDAVLQAFANAGGKQPVLPPLRPGTPNLNAIYDECNFVAGWKADFAATGKVGMHQNDPAGPWSTIGDYVTTGGGTATVYKPDVSNQTALVNEIARALSGVKSCTFDLNNLNGKKLTVDQTMLDKVAVKVQDMPVALDATNGWRMNSASELELVGSACTNWRMPQNMNIDIQIPCAAIIIQ
ncbi:MAG: vWA domain-containing protein, partial [Myxococcales bacterium]